ncbi:MAG: cell wall metabolism sensor histidine kinase WalK, partial [Planctomycetes bacterium]|nr:cell wall metabolism sensor histidine kinase WalK [Planctomycetota bacterium]
TEKGKTILSAIVVQISNQLKQLTINHELVIDVPSDLPSINADDIRIGQVITNLVSNAVAYSNEGTQITVEARNSRGEIQVSVADQGVGIQRKYIDKVFDRFYRLESGVARRKGGTGLGLAICKGIVEQHGGIIWVESELGHGSRFRFTLPTLEDTEFLQNLENDIYQ